MEKETKPYCYHNFELSRIVNEPVDDVRTTGVTSMFYEKIAYSVCTKCGEIKRSKV
jgi:hypothetical protein